MTIKPNGTDAKDVALHFVDVTGLRATPAGMAKTVSQAKNLLKSGYTKEEIIKTIDYLIEVKHVTMYSLGYVSTSINNVLAELKKLNEQNEAKKLKETIATSFAEGKQKEVVTNEESTQRNRNKSERFGVKSRFGEKFNFDLFEE